MNKPYLLYLVTVLLLLAGRQDIAGAKDIDEPVGILGFLQNVGQIRDERSLSRNDIDYRIGTNDVGVFISNKGLQYQWYRKRISSVAEHKREMQKDTTTIDMYAMSVTFIGANENVLPVSDNIQPYYENYYLPYCYGKTAHSCGKVVYKNIYPNIDWVLYTDSKNVEGFKYDLVVHPGGKVSDIKLKYKGVTTISLENAGIKVETPMGNIVEGQPYAYDAVTQKEIRCNYILDGNILRFDIGQTDNDIVIDPSISWGTLLGQSNIVSTSTAADTLGNSYLCGYTELPYYITSSSIQGIIQQPIHGGSNDGFIRQFDMGGTMTWSTYYGGEGNDRIVAAITDFKGDVFVTGSTSSSTGMSFGLDPDQRNFGGSSSGNALDDAFLSRFNSRGFLEWATYCGGAQLDNGMAVVCDNAGSVYIGGNTASSNGIYENGYRSAVGPGFFARYNVADGQRVWGSYFNGNVNALATDNRSYLFIGGYSMAYTGIGHGAVYKPSWTGGTGSAGFICRFKALTGAISWGSYYGDSANVLSLACDSFGSVYAGGYTQSKEGIASGGAHLTTGAGIAVFPAPAIATAGMFVKLDSSGQRSWGTYYPGVVRSIAIGPDHKLYIAGTTYAISGLSSYDAYQLNYAGGGDGYFSKFTTNGKCLWASYYGGGTNYGGTLKEENVSLCYGGRNSGVGGGNKIFTGGVTGGVWSLPSPPPVPPIEITPQNITTTNGYQRTFVLLPQLPYFGGSFFINIGYLGQFHADTNVYIKFPYIDTVLCVGQPLNIVYGVTNLFRPGNVFTVQLSDVTGSFVNPANIGSTTYNDRGEIMCTLPVSTPEGVGYKLRIISSAPMDTFYNYDMPSRISHYHQPRAVAIQPICANQSVTMMDTTTVPPPPPGIKYAWVSSDPSRPVGQSNPNIFMDLTLADGGDHIVVADNHGCIKKDTFHVMVTVAPGEPLVIGDTSLCIGETLRLTGRSNTPVDSFAWFNADGTFYRYDSVITVPSVMLSHAGLYKVTALLNGCQSNPTYGQIVTVHSLPLPSANSNSPVCIGDTLKLTASDTTKSVSYSWTGPQGFTHNKKDSSIRNVTMSFSGQYTVKTTTIHGCENTANTTVTIKPLPNDVGISSNSPVCTGKELLLNAGNQPGGAMFNWTGPNSYGSPLQSSVRSNITMNDAGLYKLSVSLDGCIKKDTTRVVINESPEKPKLSSNSPLLTGEVLKLNIDNAQQGLSYNWTGPRGFISQGTSPTVNNVIPAMSGVYTATVSNGICTAYDTITIIITDKKEADPSEMLIFPNPNNGVFRIKGKTQLDAVIELVVFASDGKEVYKDSVKPVNKQVDETITMTGLASGIYRLRIWVDGKPQTISFTINP